MVRRVRLGRRDASERAHRWVGPPPLLILATVLGLLVAPFVDDPAGSSGDSMVAVHASAHTGPTRHGPGTDPTHSTDPTGSTGPTESADPTGDPSAGEASGGEEAPTADPPETPQQVLPASRGGHAYRGVSPVRLKQVHVGVASFNMFRRLSDAHARSDAREVTSRSRIDVVGWQEAKGFGDVLNSLPGWSTRTFPLGGSNAEVAVSWRSSEFRLVRARQRAFVPGLSSAEGLHPFTTRRVAVVTLEHRDTGRLLTVIDAHLPQAIEDLDNPGHWRKTINAYRARHQLSQMVATWEHAVGRWVVGTGDFNFDARADERHPVFGGPRRTLGRVAIPSYERLGFDVAPTFPENDRWIDYVWAGREAYAEGRMRFLDQWVIGGLHSDHNAIAARLELR